MHFEIKPLTKALKDDYLFFFDNMIFKENPDWSICYCYDYHFLGDISTCTRASNRAAISHLIDEKGQTGYLAYDNSKPVGWCNANNRLNFKRLLRDYDFVDNPDDKACSVVCFLIHPDYRRQGIAKKFLEKIIADYSNSDFDYIEAYPKKTELSSSGNFKGPLELYKRYGFEIHKAYDYYYVMRKYLK
ncbi:MAG: GNAT family N-acetyltransferase [Bacteroidota bacterium]